MSVTLQTRRHVTDLRGIKRLPGRLGTSNCESLLKEKCKYQLRSSEELLLQLPIRKTKKSLGDRSFQTAAPVLWNSLPSSVRDIDDLLVFKRTIDLFTYEGFRLLLLD